MAAWECSAGVTGLHYHPNCTVGLLHREGCHPEEKFRKLWIFVMLGRALPALVGNNRAHVGGVGCELVITYQETGLLRRRVPVRGGSPPRGRRSKQFDPFPPGWGPGGGASNFGPLPPWVGTRRVF